MIDVLGVTKKISKRMIKTVLIICLTVVALAGSVYYFQVRDVKAAIQRSKVLIISNNDTYSTAFGNNSGLTSAGAMASTLTNYGFDVTTWIETANGGNPPTVAYANQFDVVIFTQGVGYRNTANSRQGLNVNDLNFLKEYLNITGSGNKARLLIEGEDVMSDILRVGTSTDQRDVLQISTSSSADNYGRMDRLRISDATHPVFTYVYNLTGVPEVTVNNQTNFQDYIAPNLTVGAQTIAQARFTNGNYFSTLNIWANSLGNRQIFLPFSWYVNASNGIVNPGGNPEWRQQYLYNLVRWVGERRINTTATNIANTTASGGELAGMLAVRLSPEFNTVTPLAIKGMKVTYTGTMSTAEQSNVTAIVYEDQGAVGVLDGADTQLGSASFVSGVATVNFDMEINATKNLIVAYRYGVGVPIGKTAGARLADADAVMIHDWDKLSRVYGTAPFPHDSVNSIISSGTAAIKSPLTGATMRSNVTFTGTTSTSYTLDYTSGYNNTTGPWTQFASGAAGVSNATLGTWNSGSVPDGSYTVRLRVATGTMDYISLYVDNTAPVITQGPSHTPMDNYATINWQTNEPSTTEIVYRISPAGIWFNVADSARVLNHGYRLTNLSPNTTYEYKVKSIDAAGNTVESLSRNFTTFSQGPFADITSPDITGNIIPTIGNTTSISGSAYTVRSGGTVAWSVYYGYGKTKEKITAWNLINSSTTPVNNGLLASWSTPAPDGAYVLRLRVVDPGLTGPTSFMEEYVQVNVDNSKPEVTKIGVRNITNVSAAVYWETSKFTVDQVVYGIYPGVYPYVIEDKDKDKMAFLYDLSPNKTYYYKVRATDVTHRTAESPEQTFATTNITTDLTPPDVSSVKLTAAARTDTMVDLKWNAAADNTGVAGYKIFSSLDGVTYTLRGAVPGTLLNFTDLGLSANTTYWYYLKAFDTAGNESVPTTAIQKTTTTDALHINPHGAYSKLTVMCSKCHVTHRGKKEFLFNQTQEAKMCYTCHDAAGTGSKYATEAEYKPDHQSRHPLPMEPTSKECASCHNPHLNPAIYPRLLSAETVSGKVYTSGNAFCYVCHGSGGPERVLDNTAGEHDVFELSIHNSVYLDPVSGTGIRCAPCHYNHASFDVRLTKAPEEENCYKCHGATSYQYNIPDIQVDLTKVSSHNVKGSPAAGNVECVNCHNPHYVRGGLLNTSDPYNTNIIWTGDRTTFCLRCHDADEPPQKQVSRTVNVPYSVFFPSISLTTTYSVYGWDKTPYLPSAHYSNTPTKVQCNDCHTAHGSNSKRLLGRPEDQLGDDNQGQCGNCHSTGGRNALYPKAANIYGTMGSGAASFHPTYSIYALDIHDDFEEIKDRARHAECWDCHESHTVKVNRQTNSDVERMLGTLGAPYNSNYRTIVKDQVYRLGNISGVWVDSWPATVAGYDSTSASTLFRSVILNANDNQIDNDYEWQNCLKCHSKYAYTPVSNKAPFDNPSSNSYGAFKQTDVARELNPSANYAGHSVIPRSDGTFRPMPMFNGGGTWKYYGKYAGRDDNGRLWGGDSVVKCTDCHASPGGVRGPHGSTNQFLLVAPWDPDTTGTAPPGDANHLCFRCHDYEFYTGFNRSTGMQVQINNDNNFRTQFAETDTGRNLHTEGDHSGGNEVLAGNIVVGPVSCGSCHGAVPHGWLRSDGATYNGGANNNNTQNRGLAVTVFEDGPPYNDGVINNVLGSVIPTTVGPARWTKASCAGWCNTH